MTKAIYSLDELAVKYGTDKSSKGHNYTPFYSMFFESFRMEKFKMLEIGVDSGNSLLMWAEYFPNAEIHGADIRDGYEYLTEKNPRIKTFLLDQSNEADLTILGIQNENEYKIILSDGSHMSSDDILSFETLFLYLQPGGYWCNEDLLCDYDPRWNTGVSSIERYKQVVSEVNMSGYISHDNLCSNKKEAVKKYEGNYFDNNVEWFFASTGLVVIKKLQ